MQDYEFFYDVPYIAAPDARYLRQHSVGGCCVARWTVVPALGKLFSTGSFSRVCAGKRYCY